jgi:acyl-coenzyme A synthetase/AMP-(fatty) acid ligase
MISSFNTFKTVKPLYLKNVAFGSEVFPIKQFNIWKEALGDAKFTNLYGPTEGTGMCCYYRVERNFELDEVIPVGRPFKNTEIILLNEKNERAKKGETGEICIRGTSVTLGYYNNFEKTNEVYVQNPLNNHYPELIYKTGDLGRYNENGELVFVSRKDYQIKHMGHRIELGEIEVNVNTVDGINLSGCIYDEIKGKIVLYYVGDVTEKDLTIALKAKLPRYMLPNFIVKLENMPLTANGKINRVELKKMYKQKENN